MGIIASLQTAGSQRRFQSAPFRQRIVGIASRRLRPLSGRCGWQVDVSNELDMNFMPNSDSFHV